MRAVFTPSHNSLDQIFGEKTSYVIPPYQRPYSWQALGKSDKNNQINQMWDDLWSFFNEGPKDKEYFLGSMVIISKGLRAYEVVDGQQRLTTIALLFAAMRCFLRQRMETDAEILRFRDRAVVTLERLLYNTSGVGLVQDVKVKIERASASFDFNDVLTRAIDCQSAQARASRPQEQEIIDRYFQNRDYFLARMGERFLTRGVFTADDARRFDDFFSSLNTRVSLVLIETTDFETAYSIFEILNNRGLPLTNRDLLRNFLIKELDGAKVGDPPGLWLKLEMDYALTEDFIGRWVESRTATHQRYSAFNDLLKIYQEKNAFAAPSQPKALNFYNTLRDDLQRYSLFAEPEQRVSDSAIRHKILFLRAAGNERHTANLLLALFRHYDYAGNSSEAVLDFICAYQRWMLHLLLAPLARFSSAIVNEAIRRLNRGDPADARRAFVLGGAESKRLAEDLGGNILDNDMARLLLAAIVWKEEADHQDVVTQRLDFGNATLEHVIPQSPAPNTNWLRDFDDTFRREYTYRLGNMTLLTSKMNSSARNLDFAHKRTVYQKTKLPMTVRLSAQTSVDRTYIEERHNELKAALLADLRLTV